MKFFHIKIIIFQKYNASAMDTVKLAGLAKKYFSLSCLPCIISEEATSLYRNT